MGRGVPRTKIWRDGQTPARVLAKSQSPLKAYAKIQSPMKAHRHKSFSLEGSLFQKSICVSTDAANTDFIRKEFQLEKLLAMKFMSRIP